MLAIDWFLGAFWLIFILYWAISAFGVKKNVHNKEWRRDAWVRILIVIVIVLLLDLTSYWQFFGYRFGESLRLVGVVLCGAGLAFAVWARAHLGRNWSGIPSIKENHELITSGPYRVVRHPIYTGILVALVGSVLAGGIVWLAFLVVFSANFLYRIPVEERYMVRLFPDQYPEYKKRSKVLIPFVW